MDAGFCVGRDGIPQVEVPPPQPHLHVPAPPAVLAVLIGSGGVQLGVPHVSRERIITLLTMFVSGTVGINDNFNKKHECM